MASLGAKAGAPPPGTPPPQFAICAVCHTTSADGANSMGPNLRGVVGRKAGTAPGFQYSQAMKGSGIRWTPRELDSYLTDVTAKVPGTLMPFNGLPDAQDRQAVIGYLKSLK
jgi:cytochrome c